MAWNPDCRFSGSTPANSRLFFRLPDGLGARFFLLLHHFLEPDEVSDFLLRIARKGLEIVDQLPRDRVIGRLGFAEEFAHLQLEDLEDLEERVEPDLVFALLHSGEVRLRDADLFGELGLRETPALAQLADARADQV